MLQRSRARPGWPLLLACVFIAFLWLGGGASRADVAGQAVVRAAAAVVLAALAIWGQPLRLGSARPVGWLLLAAVLLPALQLVPVPPAMWQSLPGRSALSVPGLEPGWRPVSMVPGATWNALFSLIVPVATLFLITPLGRREQAMLHAALLVAVVGGMMLGLLQFSGATFDHPLHNGSLGSVNGSFANRNHLALFLAIGCLLAPTWAFSGEARPGWRVPVGAGLTLLFVLTILATGSRAGLALGGAALLLAVLITWRPIRGELRRHPRWVSVALIAGAALILAAMVLLSVAADRAVSLDRAVELDTSEDMRTRGLPVVLAMVHTYLPWGSGFGGFDPIFRLHEPLALLKPTFFNHAHNDWLEVVLDAGIPGLLLLVAGAGWWGWASVRAWRGAAPRGLGVMLRRLGSAILLLIMLASIVDYPARTPMIMAVAVIAAVWLAGYAEQQGASALPGEGQLL